MYHLGLMYENGEYVEQDSDRALEYYRLAVDQGSEDAAAKLSDLES